MIEAGRISETDADAVQQQWQFLPRDAAKLATSLRTTGSPSNTWFLGPIRAPTASPSVQLLSFICVSSDVCVFV